MPLVTIILAKMGIANPEIMKKGRGVAIVLIFLVAAIITPPDIVSQCFVAVPMCLLYFISIFLSGSVRLRLLRESYQSRWCHPKALLRPVCRSR